MLDLAQKYKAINLIAPAAITSDTSGTQEVEVYDDDALAVVNIGTIDTNGSVVVTITGALKATPSTFDQTLATFTSATAAGIAAQRVNLAGIKTLQATADIAGSTTVNISVVALVKSGYGSSSLNSATPA